MRIDPVQRKTLLKTIQTALTPALSTADFFERKQKFKALFFTEQCASRFQVSRTDDYQGTELQRVLSSEAYTVLRSELSATIDEVQSAKELTIDLDVRFLSALLRFFNAHEDVFYQDQRFKYHYDVNFWEWVNLDLCLEFVCLRWLLGKSEINEKTYQGSLLKYLTGYTRNYSFSLWRMFLFCQDPTKSLAERDQEQRDALERGEYSDPLKKVIAYQRDGLQAFVERVNTSYDVGFSEQLNQRITHAYYQHCQRQTDQSLDPKFIRLLTKLHTAYLAHKEGLSAQVVPEVFQADFKKDPLVTQHLDHYVDFLFDQALILSGASPRKQA